MKAILNVFIIILLFGQSSIGFAQEKELPQCVFVIFGATGDLTARKLFPAIYNLSREGHVCNHTIVVGVGRSEISNEQFREKIKNDVSTYSRTKPLDFSFWEQFEKNIFYLQCELDQDSSYEQLQKFLAKLDQDNITNGNRLYYLATPPSCFSTIIEKLTKNNLIYLPTTDHNKWSRVIIEKPLGTDLSTAIELQNHIAQHLDESQIYRIDHYLGKEGVTNFLTLRFENSFLEPLWNNQFIDNVQITISEDIGIGTRGQFWEETGYLKDILQNHLLQLLAITAMEPPEQLNAESIHHSKIQLMKEIRPIASDEVNRYIVRGQYSQGEINGSQVLAYNEERNVAKNSIIETYVATKLFIDNPRWKGVPFYIRGGKRLPYQTCEIVINLKKKNLESSSLPNAIFIRIQPNPGIFFRTLSKVPGSDNLTQPVLFGFTPESYFQKSNPEAYERLILDCLKGNASLFVKPDDQIASWQLLTPIIDAWKNISVDQIPLYPAGTWGPTEADQLLEEGHEWQLLRN